MTSLTFHDPVFGHLEGHWEPPDDEDPSVRHLVSLSTRVTSSAFGQLDVFLCQVPLEELPRLGRVFGNFLERQGHLREVILAALLTDRDHHHPTQTLQPVEFSRPVLQLDWRTLESETPCILIGLMVNYESEHPIAVLLEGWEAVRVDLYPNLM